MIVTCGNCKKKYKINPEKLTAAKVKIKCKACSHHIIVEKPREPPEEVAPTPEMSEPKEGFWVEEELGAVTPQSSLTEEEAGDGGDGEGSDDDEESAPAGAMTQIVEEEAPPATADEEGDEEESPEGYSVTSGDDAAAVAYDRSGSEDKPRYRNEFDRAGVDLSPPQKRSAFGLSSKIVSIMTLVSVVPLTLLGYLVYTQVEQQLRGATEKTVTATASAMAASATSLYERSTGMLETIAALPQFQADKRKQQEPILRGFAASNPWVQELFTLNTKGMNIARSDEGKLIDYSGSGFYQEVMAGGKLVEWKNPEATLDDQSLVLALPLMKKGKPTGAVVCAITTSGLKEQLSAWDGGKSGAAFVVNGSGHIVTGAGNLTGIDSSHPLIAKFMEGGSGLVYFNWRGVKNIGVIEKGNGPWGLILLQSDREAFAALEEVKVVGLMILAITLLVAFVLAVITGVRITRPLKTLADAAYRISVGELDAEINIRRSDEIGALAVAVSRMRDSIRLSIERMRRRR